MPIYWDRSDRVRFTAKSFISKSKAVLDQAEEKARDGKAKNYGKVFYPEPVTIDGGPLPTLEEYLEQEKRKRDMAAGKVKLVDNDPFSNSGWTAPELD